MATDTQTYVIRGKTSYAKIVGEPRLNYNKDGKEWAVDIEISKDTLKEFKSWGIANKVKSKPDYLDGAPYVRFKRDEMSKFLDDDGNPKKNKPIEIVDIKGQPWDGRLLGNGTVVDVKFRVKDYGAGKQKGMYIDKVRVLDLVPYENAADFEPLNEDDEYFRKAVEQAEAEAKQFEKDFRGQVDDDLNDEIPL